MAASTKREYVVIELTDIIRDFVDEVDRSVEDLGYNVEQIVASYSGFRHGDFEHVSAADYSTLAQKFYSARIVKNEEDALFIAEIALTVLYPEITRLVKGLGYVAAIVHQVKFRIHRLTRAVFCEVLMVVA